MSVPALHGVNASIDAPGGVTVKLPGIEKPIDVDRGTLKNIAMMGGAQPIANGVFASCAGAILTITCGQSYATFDAQKVFNSL